MVSAILKTSKPVPLAIAQPSACFAIVPPHRMYKLFLLGFETAIWHVLARPSFGKPHSPGLLLGSLSTAQPSACFAIVYLSIGPSNCFYWASKLLHGTFWPGLKTLLKVPQQLSKASALHNPPLALPSYFPIGPSNCFYWASKLLHGTFWAGLKSLKSSAAAFESLRTAQPSACFAIVPPHGPYKLFLLGFEAATWHVLARP